MKISSAIAGAVLLGATLSACGGGSDDGASGSGGSGDYCKDIKAATKTFGSFGSGDISKLDSAFDTFHQLAKESPGAIKSDWATVDKAVTTVEVTLAKAGIKMSDLAKIQSGEVPKGVDVAKLQSLAPDLAKLNGPEFQKSSDAIEKHAKSECGVDLSASGS